MEKSDYKLGTVSSYGFTNERVIQDFPLRGKELSTSMFAVASGVTVPTERYLLIHMMI